MTDNINRIKPELDLITKAITDKAPAEAIYLFGSWAYGEPKSESDIDVFVVIPDGSTDVVELCGAIRFALYKKVYQSIDLLIGKKSTFAQKSQKPTLESIVAKQGILLYGK